MTWVNVALEVAMKAEDATSAAKALWKEWSAAEEHVPWNSRASIVKMLDAQLHSCGYPSLRVLISQPAGADGGHEDTNV